MAKHPLLCHRLEAFRHLDFDDLYILHCLGQGLTRSNISEMIICHDESVIRKRLRKMKRCLGEEYFSRDDKNRVTLSDEGRALASIAAAFMYSLVSLDVMMANKNADE